MLRTAIEIDQARNELVLALHRFARAADEYGQERRVEMTKLRRERGVSIDTTRADRIEPATSRHPERLFLGGQEVKPVELHSELVRLANAALDQLSSPYTLAAVERATH